MSVERKKIELEILINNERKHYSNFDTNFLDNYVYIDLIFEVSVNTATLTIKLTIRSHIIHKNKR